MDDMSDGFWSPHAPPIGLHGDADVEQLSSSAAEGMNRSSSEWALQRFLQESTFPTDGIDKIKANHHHPNDNQQPQPAAVAISADPDEYQAFLKSRLELACAAVALTRVIVFF